MWFSLTFKLDIQEEKGGQAKFGPSCSLLLAVLMKSLRVKCLPFTRHKISYDNDNIKPSFLKKNKKINYLDFYRKMSSYFLYFFVGDNNYIIVPIIVQSQAQWCIKRVEGVIYWLPIYKLGRLYFPKLTKLFSQTASCSSLYFLNPGVIYRQTTQICPTQLGAKIHSI